jgi:DNA-binding NarL/FixJ family response regulator
MPDTTNILLIAIFILLVTLLVAFVKLLRRPPAHNNFDRVAPPATTPSLQPPNPQLSSDGALDQLTPRECDVALLAARGLTNRQIGAELNLSVNTVSNHLKRVYAKLGVHSRAELSWRLQYFDLRAGPPPDVAD